MSIKDEQRTNGRTRRRTHIALAALCACLAHGMVPAQGSGAGQVERQFSAPPALPSGEGPVVPSTPGQLPPPDGERVRFVLASVALQGSTVYDATAVTALAGDRIGREVSLAEVYALATELTQAYRNDGYVLSRVIVPPQNIRDGRLQLQAVEGYVALARWQGSTAGPHAAIDQHLEAVRASRPLAAGVLERELLLLNDLPGVTARSTLAASALPGASDLTVDLTERRTAFSAGLNNRGSRSLGPARLDVSGDAHQLLAGFDKLSARLIQTVPDDEMRYVSLGYERWLGASGARLGLNLSAVDAEPGGNQNFNLPTTSRSATLSASYPWLRSRVQSLTVRASLSRLHSRTDAVVGDVSLPVSEDRITALRAGATLEFIDAWRGVSVFDLEASRGLSAFGASDADDTNLSVLGGRPDFNKLTLYAARLQGIVPKWSLLTAVSAQYSGQTLLSPERFAFGGEQFGRAYDSAELTGDSGAALKLELRFADAAPQALGRYIGNYTLYGFYDVGQVRRHLTSPGQNNAEPAAAAGLGLRVSTAGALTGYLELAKPLTRTVAQEGNRSVRVFVGIQAGL